MRQVSESSVDRREFLGSLATAATAASGGSAPPEAPREKALVAITLDLEMSRNFPTWDQTHWDYQKGNLNAETKAYAVEAAKRVKAHGGVPHFFAVGQVFEQENVDWMKDLAAAGHPIGNHSYDHVYVLATKPEDIQFRFKRSPWLIEGKSTAEAAKALYLSPKTVDTYRSRMMHKLGIDNFAALVRFAIQHGVSPLE